VTHLYQQHFCRNTVNYDGEADADDPISHASVGLENGRSFAGLARELPRDAFKKQRHTKKPARDPEIQWLGQVLPTTTSHLL